MKNEVTYIVVSILCASLAFADSTFHSPDAVEILKYEGFGKKIVSTEGGIIKVDCGGGRYDDYFWTLDTSTGRIVERVLKEAVDLPEWEARKYEGKKYIDNVNYASFPCDVVISSSVRRMEGDSYEYKYVVRVLPDSRRGLNSFAIGTADYYKVLEPRSAEIGKLRERKPFSRRVFVNICDLPLRSKGSKLDVKGVMIIGFKSGKFKLDPNEQSTFRFLSRTAPGIVPAYGYCEPLPDRELGIPVSKREVELLDSLLVVYYPMRTLVVAPRHDLMKISPNSRIASLIEDMPKFRDVGWIDGKNQRIVSRALRNIHVTKTSPMQASITRNRIARLAEKIKSMSEEELSIEVRTILTVNLELLIDYLK